MPTTDLNHLSASAVARKIAIGETSAVAVVEACLARIEEREGERHAWAFIDPDLALEQARACDKATPRGLLHGVPLGVKDIIDTSDMPTEMGSPIYAGRRPPADAACVALVRRAGAIILGKTVTTEFAGSFPGPTTNPYDSTRSPGGSSSGSAAAVADLMAPAAFGTQTGSSILRPSAYCGVIGYKPTFGTFNIAGIKAASQSLDTLGLHVRDLDDIQLLTAVLVNRPLTPLNAPATGPKIGVCRTPLWDVALPETQTALEDAASRLAQAGASVREVTVPTAFDTLEDARIAINCYERSRHMTNEWRDHRDALSDMFQAVMQTGLDMPYDDYVAAMRLTEDCRQQSDDLFDGLDVLLAPCVDGEAPEGLEYSGNPRLPGFWTAIRLPAISLPTHTGPNGLPVGIQLVGRYRDDDRLLSVAKWVLEKLGSPTLG
ncbi:MAG: Asp-tRNA(Asn)/Glu-tRNA(Gln) amidotransferase A subunit family amidase [Alphaproteobacteria bacterium]|jgi:Asp-tRNA(Asn)/Glu-tRNA(Gln) amidotransferase A subunit family amidase